MAVRMSRCIVCGQTCYIDKLPEIVFRRGQICICSDCSLDYENINGKLQRRREQK